MVNIDNFTQLNISDIHLLHARIPTESIIKGLNYVIEDSESMRQYHRINLVGDVFDRVVDWDNEQLTDVSMWIIRVLNICKKYDIQLRVLKGTPSHDGDQSQRFVYYNDLLKIGCDLKYVDEVSILIDERYGDSTFYVPDRIRARHVTVYEEFLKLLEEKGLTECDFGMFHGFFEHQVPSSVDCHQSSWYENHIRHYIACGHDHNMKVKGKILVQGSFDRLSHNEEEAKGYMVTQSNAKETYSIVFKENTHATRFRKIPLEDSITEKELDRVKDEVLSLPRGSFVSFRFNNKDLISWVSVISELLTDRGIRVTTDKLKVEKVELPEIKSDYHPVALNANTIPGLLMQRLESEQVAPEVIERALALLGDL